MAIKKGEHVPWINSNHRRVAGGRPQTVKNMDGLRERSDELNIPMWLLSEEEFQKIFSTKAKR